MKDELSRPRANRLQPRGSLPDRITKDEGGRMNCRRSCANRLQPRGALTNGHFCTTCNLAAIDAITTRPLNAGNAKQRAATGARQAFLLRLQPRGDCLDYYSPAERGNCDPTRCVGGGAGRVAPQQ